MVIKPKVYDVLKWVSLVLLPALASLYAGLAVFWGFPNVTAVVGTITLVDTFLGALLGISSAKYKHSDARFDGTLNVIESDTSLVNQLEIRTAPEQLANQEALTLRVNKIEADIPLDSPPRS